MNTPARSVARPPRTMSSTDHDRMMELGEISAALAMMGGMGAGAFGSRAARRHEAAADQMTATLDAIGLPTSPVARTRGRGSVRLPV